MLGVSFPNPAPKLLRLGFKLVSNFLKFVRIILLDKHFQTLPWLFELSYIWEIYNNSNLLSVWWDVKILGKKSLKNIIMISNYHNLLNSCFSWTFQAAFESACQAVLSLWVWRNLLIIQRSSEISRNNISMQGGGKETPSIDKTFEKGKSTSACAILPSNVMVKIHACLGKIRRRFESQRWMGFGPNLTIKGRTLRISFEIVTGHKAQRQSLGAVDCSSKFNLSQSNQPNGIGENEKQ